MLAKVRETIAQYGMLTPGDRVIAAVSGGPDSMALLAVLHLLSREFDIRLVVAHLNHGLRPEAPQEALLVNRYAESWGCPFVTECIDVAGLSRQSGKSLEEAGREARYAFLDRTARIYGARKIALGHHRQDQAETVLMNLMRGSGLEGLRGMTPLREGRYMRPLLFIDRAEIVVFLRERGIDFIIDSSNDDPFYLRNRIRGRLLPSLRETFNPNIDKGLSHLAEIVRLENDFMESLVDRTLAQWEVGLSGPSIVLPVTDWRGLPEALQNRMIKRLLETLAPHGRGIAFTHIMAVRKLLIQGGPAGSLSLPFSIGVKREYGKLLIFRRDRSSRGDEASAHIPDFTYPVEVPGEVHIAETGVTIRLTLENRGLSSLGDVMGNPTIALLDYDRIQFPLIIRNIRAGDRIQPLGMKGRKKVKAWFIDEKIPRDLRRSTPLLVDRRSVLWIGGGQTGEGVRITDRTSRILKVEII
jgi:tRNA(Ile)-lysidine synthase